MHFVCMRQTAPVNPELVGHVCIRQYRVPIPCTLSASLLKLFPDNCTVSRLTVQLECIFLHTRNRVQKAKSSRSIS